MLEEKSLFILFSLNTYLSKVICKETSFSYFLILTKCKFSSLKLEKMFCEMLPHFQITYTSLLL